MRLSLLFLPLAAAAAMNVAGAPAPSLDEALLANARAVQAKIQTHETEKDATCWTTVRTMENFYSHRILDEAAVLQLIEARKELIFEIWHRATPKTLAGNLTREDLAPLTERLRTIQKQNLLDSPIKSNMSTDYNRVTENWRAVTSLLGERLAGVGDRGALLPLDESALDELGSLSTQMTVMLLDQANLAAQKAQHTTVAAADITKAYDSVVKSLGLTAKGVRPAAPGKASASGTVAAGTPAASPAVLRELTMANMEGKVSALKGYNGLFWNDASKPKDPASLFNQIAGLPVTPDVAEKILAQLRKFAAVPGYGVVTREAMTYRAANTFANINELADYAKAEAAKGGAASYIDLAAVSDYTADVMPHQLLPNGDIKLKLIPSPVMRADRQTANYLLGDVVMTSTDLDASRDLVVHWSTLREVWQDEAMKPMDPFAQELLAERISEMAVLMLKLGERQARQIGAAQVNGAMMDFVLAQEYFLAPEGGASDEWVKKDKAAEARIFAAFGKKDPFTDETRLAGFGAKTCGVKIAPEAPSLQNFMGSGVAVRDLDGDGLPEVFVAGDGCNRLYKNLGKGKFKDVTQELGLADDSFDSRQALFADLDNDGSIYLFVAHSASPSRLFHLGPDEAFHDVTAASGIKTNPTAHSAFFADYDNDGRLDLFVGHYGPKVPGELPAISGRNGTGNQLYRGLGNGKFSDVSEAAGIVGSSWTLAAGAFDFNHDGCQDIFVANDWGRSQLYVNDCKGHYEEKSDLLGVDERGSGMNASFVDVNNDGFLGVYLSVIDMFSKKLRFVLPRPGSPIKLDDKIIKTASYFSGNKLLANDHGKGFVPVEAQHFDSADKGWAWSAVFFDYANKGAQDMYLANGWIPDSLAGKQANKLFINDGGKFVDMTERSPAAGFQGFSRAAAAVDLRGDGYQDLLVTGLGMPSVAGAVEPTLHYLRNASGTKNHWLKVRPRGVRNNRDGVGAEVTVFTPDGKRQTKLVSSGINYLAQEATTLTFGVGKNTSVSRVEVRWPGRKEPQTLATKVGVNKTVDVVEDVSGDPKATH